MPLRIGSILYFIGVLISTSNATDCKPLAVSFPFKSNVLANRAEARGVPWQIGSPNAQTIVLLPSATYNDTYMYGANGLCASNITIEECTTYRGGLYNSALSDSEKVGASIKHIFDDATATWTTDKVTINDVLDKNIELNPHEFGIRVGTAHEFVNRGELGLGKNSTFLNALTSGQRIASKTYSFFWGTDNAISDNPRNGSLTLGGYDQALIGDSPNTTTTFTRNEWRCREGMIVDLTGLALQSESGGVQNLLNETDKLQACIVPTLSNVLMLPEQYWDRMADKMGVKMSPQNNGMSGELFYHVASVQPKSATFTGNLSITINNAVTVVIPNKQLIFDEPYIASNGLIKRNSTWKNIPVVKYTDLNQNMPRLGGMFLSSAYLMVNHDKNEFTISAVQEKVASQKLMGIDTANACVSAVQGEVKTTSETPKSSSDAVTSAKGISGGVIAGIAVGAVALIAFITGIVFLVWRRRRTAAAAAPYKSELDATHTGIPVAEKCGYNASEMYVEPETRELGGHARDYAVEMDGRSRPVEIQGYGTERDRRR